MKRPILIYILATVYLISPLVNFLITLWIYGVPQFYTPRVWVEWVPKIGGLSWVFILCMSLSGIALLLKRKWSWTWALVVLALTAVLNVYLSVRDENAAPLNHEWTVLSTVSVIIIVWSFKFPYIDRREQWLKVAYRFPANIPIEIQETKKTGIIKNLSLTGALIQTAQPLPPIGLLVEVLLGERGRFHAKVVRAQGRDHIGVQFCYLSRESQSQVKRLITHLRQFGPLHGTESPQELEQILPFMF